MSPSGGNQGREHRTLFAVELSEERAARRIAQTARGAGSAATSDVRRHRPMLIAALAACAGVLVGWRFAPSALETGRGTLALPHERAGLACTSCHEENGPPPAAHCQGCHGPHASVRPGHRALAKDGKLGCVRCHDVHGADEGVRFAAPGGQALRYAVGRSEPLDGVSLPSAHDVTVPLVPLTRCGGACHDTTRADDPIGRCVSGGLSMCFDEHQEWSAVAPARAGGVCGAQHGNDRFAAWEAARDVAARVPSLPPASARGPAIWWVGSGAAAAALGVLAYAGGMWLARRRRQDKRASAVQPAERVRLPQIDTNTCLGCYACVDACPYDVLQIERYVAFVARPEACCGLTLCEQVCPNGSLVITDGEPIGDRPRIDEELRAEAAPGIYLAGDVTGLPLIKNAIAQGARAVESIAGSLPKHAAPLDLVIVGAGPAGISAALRAKEAGLRCEVIEQGSVAQSIRSFPRGKLIFDQPLELPVAGELWLAEATKEELLAKWLRVIRQEKLTIHEDERFTGIERDGDVIVVQALRGPDAVPTLYRTARVLLAVGLRGTPRRLDLTLTPEAESRVFYHLADARSFAGQRAVVVGLGDVAMETAIALARQPDTRVTVVYRGPDFSRGKSRNIDELRRLAAADRVELVFGAVVQAIDARGATLSTGARLDADAIFVMIGNEPPRALLEKCGIQLGPSLHS